MSEFEYRFRLCHGSSRASSLLREARAGALGRVIDILLGPNKNIRLIPDAMDDPVPLVAADGRCDPAALDLSWAHLRSVSPAHLDSMRNMGTLASLSVSIVVRGRL